MRVWSCCGDVGLKMFSLGDVATIDRNSLSPENIQNGTKYIGLEHITGDGTFNSIPVVSNGELNSSKFKFDSSHVLYGKLRPYLKKIALPSFSGICSTDILPIKPGPDLDRNYLFYYLRQPSMIQLATSLCSGINLPRLSPKRLVEFKIPLPPLAEQKRIAAILDKADMLRTKRRAALAKLDSLVQSVFLEMFGDPGTNPMGWEVKMLSKAFKIKPQIGTAKPAHFDGKQVVVRVGELGGDKIALQKCGTVTLLGKDLEKYSLEVDDFLLARAIGSENHLGKASILHSIAHPVVYDSHVMRLRFEQEILLPYFFLIWMKTKGGRARFMRRAGRTAVQFNINAKQIGRVEIPLPPIDLQQQFNSIYQSITEKQKVHAKHLNESDNLFHALQQRAFRGEL